MKVDLFLHGDDESKRRFKAIEDKIDDVIWMLENVLEKESEMSAEMDDLTAEVARNSTVDASAMALIAGLGVKIDAITAELASAGADVTKLVSLRNDLSASSDALAAAVAANTPAAPPAPPADPVPDPVPPVDPDPIV